MRVTIKSLQNKISYLRCKLKQSENKNSYNHMDGISEPLLVKHMMQYILQYIKIHNEQTEVLEDEISTSNITIKEFRGFIVAKLKPNEDF